jgi:hypothetical protein
MEATNVNAPEVMLFCGSGVDCIAWLALRVAVETGDGFLS